MADPFGRFSPQVQLEKGQLMPGEQHVHDGVAATLWPSAGVSRIDRAEFFDLARARKKIKAGQEAFIEELEAILTNRQKSSE